MLFKVLFWVWLKPEKHHFIPGLKAGAIEKAVKKTKAIEKTRLTKIKVINCHGL